MESTKVRKYTLDASVVVKWFADEEDSDKARALKKDFVDGTRELNAPTLLSYEVANALRWHPVVKMSSDRVARALVAIESYQFLAEPSIHAWTEALELSYSGQISIYDAIYIGFALATDSQLVTADRKLIARIPISKRQHVLALDSLDKEQ